MTPQAPLSYRPDIQGLRAIAIGLVVLAHFDVPQFQGGFVGVDVFFVLSGFLITGLLLKEYETTGSIHLVNFIGRRLRRLLPALLAMMVVVIAAADALLTNYEVEQQVTSATYAATWTSNLFFAFTTFDYFAASRAEDLFLHTWSLSLDEQFYVISPLTQLIFLKLTQAVTASAELRSKTLVFFGVLIVGSLVLSNYWSANHPLWSFYLMPSRIWQFALGGVVFVVTDQARDAAAARAPATAALLFDLLRVFGLALIVGSAMLLDSNRTYPGLWAILPSLGCAAVLAAGRPATQTATSRMLTFTPLVWLGDRSYSLYLWHWPALLLGSTYFVGGGMSNTIAMAAIALALAMCSYRWVEFPFWKGRFRRAAPLKTIYGSMFAILLVGGGAWNYQEAIRIDPERLAETSRARADLPVLYAQGCDLETDVTDLMPCVSGNADSRNIAVLLGDSIGVQWHSALATLYASPDWQLITLTKSACPMVDEDFFYARIGATFRACTEWRNKALAYISELEPAVVFIGSSSGYEFTPEQWINGSTRVLSTLTAAADDVVIIPGTPSLSFNGPSCLERHGISQGPGNASPKRCMEMPADRSFESVAAHLAEAVSRYDNASLMDLNDLVCPEGLCTARNVEDIVVFRDNGHVTDSFARSLIPVIAERLASVLPGIPLSRDDVEAAPGVSVSFIEPGSP